MLKPVSPKQRALIEYLGLPVPGNSSEASRLIESASEDERYRIRFDDWKHARRELHPSLYPAPTPLAPHVLEELLAESKKQRSTRLRKALQEEIPEQIIDIKKRVTVAQADAAILWLDRQFPGWDKGFINCRDNELDAICNYFAPALAYNFPELLKSGCTRGLFPNEKGLRTRKKNTPSGCMKMIIAAIALALISPGIYDIVKARQATPQPAATQQAPATQAAATVPTGPSLAFTAIVTQHIPGGLLIRADDFLEALPKGYTLSDINGDFFLVGYPAENNTADGARLAFKAAHAELFSFTSVLGAKRTVRKIIYTAPYETRGPSAVSRSQRVGGG